MLRVSNGAVARGRPIREHGRHIFAYCNVTTNQVLYSLTQNLQGYRSLKQLPDAGANNNPPKLRKDLWRPFWSLTLPDGKTGLAQGISAYKKLCDLRKLHEFNWESPPELARPTTKEEIEEIQSQLDERGGKKIDTAYDIIKKRKKKIRQRMVMDQKANSVADLAAVLIKQDELGAKTVEEQEIIGTAVRDNEVAEMLKLAYEARNGALEKIDAQIQALLGKIQAKNGGKDATKGSNRGWLKGISALEMQKRKIEFSANAVAAAEQGYTWNPNRELTAEERGEALRSKLRSTRKEIEARREAEPLLSPDPSIIPKQPADELGPEEAMMAQDSSVQEASPPFQHRHRDKMLELEMIRRLHTRPARVAEALQAYRAREGDIDQLRRLVQHWESIFTERRKRVQRQLEQWEGLQAAVEEGEEATKTYLAYSSNSIQQNADNVEFDQYTKRSPSRIRRVQDLKEKISFLDTLIQLSGASRSIEDIEANREKDFALLEPYKDQNFALTSAERGDGSELKVIGPARAHAMILAKAKVEARANKLSEELESGAVAETAEDVPEAAAEAEEGLEVQNEQLSEPTGDELAEAIKQVRRLSKRVSDVDNIASYEAAVEQLSQGLPLDTELKARWTPFSLAEKQKQYEAHLENLKQWVPTLQRARQLLAQLDGVELLTRAAEDARDRSLAARAAKEWQTEREFKHQATMYETVAHLRQYEDLILQATPETAAEKAADEAAQVAEQAAPSADSHPSAIDPVQQTKVADEGTSIADSQASETDPGQQEDAASGADASPTKVNYHALLPSLPERTIYPEARNRRETRRESKTLRSLEAPVYSLSGVTVKWNNMLDAEYAESWPEQVRHEPMGLSRHTAPRADQEPIFDVAEFKNQPGGGYKGKKFARKVEKCAVSERVVGVTDWVVEAVRGREREKDRLKREGRERLMEKRARDRAEGQEEYRKRRSEEYWKRRVGYEGTRERQGQGEGERIGDASRPI